MASRSPISKRSPSAAGTAKYGVVVWAPPSLNFPHADLAVEQFAGLSKDLNPTIRFAGLSLGGAEGAVTAGAVCTWISGYPLRVSYATGAPDYDPYRWSIARMLQDKEGDLLIWIASISPDLCSAQDRPSHDRARHAGTEARQRAASLHPRGDARARPCRAPRPRRQCRVPAAQRSRPCRSARRRRRARRDRSRPLSLEPTLMLTKLTGGKVYDPANKVSGEVRDIYVEDGKIVAARAERQGRSDLRHQGQDRDGGRHRPAHPYRRRQDDDRPHAAARGPPRRSRHAHGA